MGVKVRKEETKIHDMKTEKDCSMHARLCARESGFVKTFSPKKQAAFFSSWKFASTIIFSLGCHPFFVAEKSGKTDTCLCSSRTQV